MFKRSKFNRSRRSSLITLGVFSSLLCGLVLGTVAVPKSMAQSTPPPASSAVLSLPTTEQVLEQVCTFLQRQSAFTVEMDITYDNVTNFGNKVQYSAYQMLSVQKPNRLRSNYVGDERVTDFYYDGKTFTLLAADSGYYTSQTAPSNLDALFTMVEQEYGMSIPMSNLVVANPCAELTADIQESIFVGTTMVDREPMYQILMLGQERDYQIWVTRDPQPLLRKTMITYKDLPGDPQYTVNFSQWNFRPQFAADTFTFTPSDEASAIPILPLNTLPALGVPDSAPNSTP